LQGTAALPDRHFVVCYSGSRYDLREISTEVAASVMSYGVVNMDYVCQAGECWHFYFINAHFAHRHEREAALTVLIPMVEAAQRDSSLK
jgi:hypothetical protein